MRISLLSPSNGQPGNQPEAGRTRSAWHHRLLGEKLLDPSDDPAGWARTMNLKTKHPEMETFQENIQFGLNWGEITKRRLSHLSTVISDAKEVASDALGEEAAEKKAANIQFLEQAVKDALEMGNTMNGNRYLFQRAGRLLSRHPFHS